MKQFLMIVSLLFIPLELYSAEKESNQVLLICTKVSGDFVDDLNLDLPKVKKNTINYMLLVWNSSEEPFHLTGDNRFISPANAYIFNGAMHVFNASLFSTVTEDLSEVASVLYLKKGKTDNITRHGLFYLYNKDSGIYKNIDYISSVGRVHQLETKPYHNKECESKFPEVSIEHADNDSSE